MQDEAVDKDRKVIPRWRPISKTPTAELLPSKAVSESSPIFDSTLLDRALEKWEHERDIGNATEVVDGAVVSGDLMRGQDAARFLISRNSSATEAVKLVAYFVLGIDRDDKLIAEHGSLSDTLRRSVCQKQIALLRRRALDYPLDAFSWLEIGRLQTSLGQLKPARQAVFRALGASDDNRVVLRAASRFFLHQGDKGLAHRILAGSNLVRFDPWVQAAEIAMAHVAGKSSVSLAGALRSLRDEKRLTPRRSELAAAVATEEMHAGRNKSAKKLMRLSLTAPTDNSLAQGLWMRANIKLDINPRSFDIPSSYEANARAYAEAGDFRSAIWHCFRWLVDEPYSTRPAIAGSYFAAAIMQDYHQALAFIQRALTANPSDIILRNNQVVALAYLGDIDKAEEIFKSIGIHVHDDRTAGLLQATAGLLAFRRNQINIGRKHYSSAIEYGLDAKHLHFVLAARIYWLEQEIVMKSLQGPVAKRVLSEVEKNVMKLKRDFIISALWESRKGYLTELSDQQNLVDFDASYLERADIRLLIGAG